MKTVGYRKGTLEIEFLDGDVYRYFDVPPLLFLQSSVPSRWARSSTSGSAIDSGSRGLCKG